MYLVRGVKDERIITLEQIEWKEVVQFCKVLFTFIKSIGDFAPVCGDERCGVEMKNGKCSTQLLYD